MRKRNLLLAFIFLFGMFIFSNVSAKEVYFTNDNGVSLTQDEYEYFTKLYSEDYPNILTQEKYDLLKEYNLIDKDKVEITTKYDFSSTYHPQGTFHQTASKRISIGKICANGTCNIVTSVKWLVVPSVRSYDTIGAYFIGTSRKGGPDTTATSGTYTNYPVRTKTSISGLGQTVKLPNGDPVVIVQDFVVAHRSNATVYATYQHAQRNISLENSQLYNIDFGGYGGVLYFYGAAYGVYDAMAGVETTL